MYLFDLGARIREARRKAGTTQTALAAETGLGRTTVNQLEAGVYPDLGIKKVVRLLRAVGLDLAVVPASRGASPDYLRMACVSANVSFRQQLQPEQLAQAILSGAVPAGFRPHLRVIFEEAPQEVVLGAMSQLSGDTRALTRVVESARTLAEQVGCELKVAP